MLLFPEKKIPKPARPSVKKKKNTRVPSGLNTINHSLIFLMVFSGLLETVERHFQLARSSRQEKIQNKTKNPDIY